MFLKEDPKILFIRPDAMGDVLLMLPSIKALKDKYPRASICTLVRNYTKLVLENNSLIDKIMIDDEIFDKKFRFSNFRKLYRKIKKEKFDIGVCSYGEFVYALLLFLARIRMRMGDKLKIINSLFLNRGVNLPERNFFKHTIEIQCELLRPLGVEKPAPDIPVIVKEMKNKKINLLFANKDKLVAGIHIGSGKTSNKPLAEKKFAKIIGHVVKAKNGQVLLLGGKEEIERGKEIENLCESKPINLVGKLTLDELIQTINKLNIYIGPDTGPTHLAAALKIPTVVFFIVKRAKPLKWGPWGTRHLVVKSKNVCPYVCTPKECKENPCINSLDIKEVIDSIDTVLQGGGVKEKKETFLHWCQKTLIIAIFCNSKKENDIEKTKRLINLLSENNYEVLLIRKHNDSLTEWVKKQNINVENKTDLINLLKIFIKYDVNILHQIEEKNIFSNKLAILLSGIYLPCPTLFAKGYHEKKMAELEKLLNHYQNLIEVDRNKS